MEWADTKAVLVCSKSMSITASNEVWSADALNSSKDFRDWASVKSGFTTVAFESDSSSSSMSEESESSGAYPLGNAYLKTSVCISSILFKY